VAAAAVLGIGRGIGGNGESLGKWRTRGESRTSGGAGRSQIG
jgi:hypothetical protein